MHDAGLISQEPFIAHKLEDLIRDGVFPANRLPSPQFYGAMVRTLTTQSYARIWRIRYRSDAYIVNGILVTPSQIQEKGHPVIIFNRGGNRNFGMLTAPTAIRYLLPLSRRNNALVFASQYRGVDGGEGKDEMGGADIEDVLALTRIALAHPGWDGKHSLMFGISRGGMMTYQALKRGAAVKAAVVVAGTADLARSQLERPEMGKEYAATMPDYYLHREVLLQERSALCWPEKLHIPLLLLHGDADDRVSVKDSAQLSEALTKLGRPHQLVVYPGDDHGLMCNWEDALCRTDDWLKQYI